MSTTIMSVAVANPVYTKNANGIVSIDWPESEPDVCLVSRELMVEMVAQINELRVLKAGLDALAVGGDT